MNSVKGRLRPPKADFSEPKEEPMTLGELAAGENLVGRVFRAHEKTRFAYRGIIARAETRGDLVYLFLRDHARCFEGRRRGSWKHLPDAEIRFGKDTLVRKTVGEIFDFSLTDDGGRAYFYPKGTRLEDTENASDL
jgi:hypothetical protein